MAPKLEPQSHAADVAWPKDSSATRAVDFSIGDLAREYGVSLRTLRFYESKGLLTPRRDGTARLYSADDRRRLALILQGKRLGFTLAEIRNLLAQRMTSNLSAELELTPQQCLEQLKVLERQKSEIEEAIAVLRQTYSSLSARSAAEDAGTRVGRTHS